MGIDADIAASLSRGEMSIVGRLVDSSNAALVVKCQPVDQEQIPAIVAVYKPTAGERPLWDFHQDTLGHREVASYLLSEALGWALVPVTVWRNDGPAGHGMCQQWIETDPTDDFVDIVPPDRVPADWHVVVEGRGSDDEPVVLAHSDALALRRMAAFDAIINNADRKVGHLLVTNDHLLGIDHGVTFNADHKLRTVLWGFAGLSIDESISNDLATLHDSFWQVAERLRPHLREQEIDATYQRLVDLTASGVFPHPSPTGPAIPWPII